MHATDRIVLVEMGFGVWEGGRHRASARWSDVARVRVLDRGARGTRGILLELRLRNGTDIIVHPALPGFEELVAVAEQRLHGMQPLSGWIPTVATAGSAGEELVLFERTR